MGLLPVLDPPARSLRVGGAWTLSRPTSRTRVNPDDPSMGECVLLGESLPSRRRPSLCAPTTKTGFVAPPLARSHRDFRPARGPAGLGSPPALPPPFALATAPASQPETSTTLHHDSAAVPSTSFPFPISAGGGPRTGPSAFLPPGRRCVVCSNGPAEAPKYTSSVHSSRPRTCSRAVLT